VLALLVPAAAGAIEGAAFGGWRNGIVGAGSMFGLALLAFVVTIPAGALVGVMTGAAALFARHLVTEVPMGLRMVVIVAVAATVSALGTWLAASTAIPLFADIAIAFAISGGIGGGLIGGLTERSYSRKTASSDR